MIALQIAIGIVGAMATLFIVVALARLWLRFTINGPGNDRWWSLPLWMASLPVFLGLMALGGCLTIVAVGSIK